MRVIILSSLLLLQMAVAGQTLEDALRFSIHDYNSTARFAGVSGAFSALGADVSVASINPAGIAEFRKSEIAFTLNRHQSKNQSTYEGDQLSIDNNKVRLGNISAVITYNPASFNVKTFNLAIGFNQLSNFSERVSYSGRGAGTIVERFLEQAESLTPDELDSFEGGPAFDAGAIYNFDNGTSYFSDFPTLDEVVTRSEIIERSGSLNEVFVAVASNIANRFSWGVTLGFPFASFDEVRNYSEADTDGTIDIFDAVGFNQSLSTSGVGFNLKAGMIFKLNRNLRLGAAFHTKSYYFLTDEFRTNVSYSFTEGGSETLNAESPLSEFEYQFESPWRVLGGLGYIYSFGDLKGFISGEIEYVNYSKAAFNLTANSNDPLDQFFEDDLNNELDLFLASALNVRVGTEIAYKKGRVRLGALLPKSPFNEASELDFNPSFSGGLGYRGNKFYVDAAITLRSSSSTYSPYRLTNASRDPLIGIDRDRTIVTLTVGSKL